MHESTSSTGPAPVAGARTLKLLGGCLLLGLLLQAVLARVDRVRSETLETFSETTAVGDHIFYPVPSPPPDPPSVVARVRGEALVPVSYAKFDVRDTKMQASARDPVTKLTIYTCRASLPDAGGEMLYFVKTAPNEYLRLHAQKP